MVSPRSSNRGPALVLSSPAHHGAVGSSGAYGQASNSSRPQFHYHPAGDPRQQPRCVHPPHTRLLKLAFLDCKASEKSTTHYSSPCETATDWRRRTRLWRPKIDCLRARTLSLIPFLLAAAVSDVTQRVCVRRRLQTQSSRYPPSLTSRHTAGRVLTPVKSRWHFFSYSETERHASVGTHWALHVGGPRRHRVVPLYPPS